MNEQQLREILVEYFPVDWRVTCADNLATAQYKTTFYWSHLSIKVTSSSLQMRTYWTAQILMHGEPIVFASDVGLNSCLGTVKGRWEEFIASARSLITPPVPNHKSVITEDGFEFTWQDDGTWTDGDLIFEYCPTDGFFMHGHHGRVLQLKATSQVANGKFFLSKDVKVSSDDMRDMGYWELASHPGYVGEPPEPSEVFVVQSEQEWNAAIAKIEALHGVEPYCPIYSDQRNSKVWLHVHDEKAGKFFRYYIENRMISDLLDR